MGYADHITHIYVPLNKNRHWYLMVVDFTNSKLVYLDSAKVPLEHDDRVAQMRNAFFIETLLANPKMYEEKKVLSFHPSTYDIKEPTIGQQARDSKDCGMWVSQWMIMSNSWCDMIW
ncbi:hypothetical protein S245_067065, partial [Arachis hypogaea]